MPPQREDDPVQWKQWPTDKPLPDVAFSAEGLLITARAKLRPCLVLTLREEIEAFGEVHLLPLSGFRGGATPEAALVRAGQVPYAQFLPGDAARGFEDATADFRWTWRVRETDFKAARHEAELDPESLVRLLLRFRDYLYLAGDS